MESPGGRDSAGFIRTCPNARPLEGGYCTKTRYVSAWGYRSPCTQAQPVFQTTGAAALPMESPPSSPNRTLPRNGLETNVVKKTAREKNFGHGYRKHNICGRGEHGFPAKARRQSVASVALLQVADEPAGPQQRLSIRN